METLYFIKIEPAGLLFFGNPAKETDANGNNTSYYLRSNAFPQQAGVLGLLRHLLALQNNVSNVSDKRIPDKNHLVAKELIGSSGFDPNNSNYGVINGISPVFISNAANEHFFFSQYDHQINKDRIYPISRSNETMDVYYKDQLINHQILNNFKAKNQWQVNLINENKRKLMLVGDAESNDSIFIETERVGIKKNIKGELRSDAYYKQAFFQMRKQYAFACYASLSENKLPQGTCFMPFGKERKLVKISIQISNQQTLPIDYSNGMFQLHHKIPEYNPNSNRVLLLSPTFITESEFVNCVSNAICEIQPHGNISTKLANTPGNAKLMKEIKQTIVLPSGSILFIKNKAAWEQAIAGKKNYQIAGYNYFMYVNEPSFNIN